MRESRSSSRSSYDIPGAITSTAGLFLLVYGFTIAGSHGWGDGLTLALLGGSAVMLALFTRDRVAHRASAAAASGSPRPQSRRLVPRIAPRRVRDVGLVPLPHLFLQLTLHYSALRTGFAFLPFSGGIILGAGMASKLLPVTGPRRLMVVGLAIAALGLLWFTRLGVHSTYVGHVLAPELLVSFGMGLTFVPMRQHRPHRRRPEGRRRRQCVGEYDPNRVGVSTRHGVPQHDRRFSHSYLLDQSCPHPSGDCRSVGARLHDVVHDRCDLRCRGGPHRRSGHPRLPARCPARAGVLRPIHR